jgi:hypothetical protein
MLAGFLHQLDEADLGFSRGDLPVTVGNSRLPGSGDGQLALHLNAFKPHFEIGPDFRVLYLG